MWFSERRAAAVAFTDTTEGNLAGHTGEDPAAVSARRAELEHRLGLPGRSLRFLHQVHGTRVVRLGAGRDPDEAPVADAAVSEDGTPLAVLAADCLPVVFEAENPRSPLPLTGVAHAGRRGLLDGVLDRTVAVLRERGGRDLTAWIGPAICGSCYEVPTELRDASGERLEGIAAQTSWGTPGLDLPGAASRRLRELGVRVATDHVDRCRWCTLEHTDLYSYRRDRTTSRLAGLVWVPEASTGSGKGGITQ